MATNDNAASSAQLQIEALWDGMTKFGSTRNDEALDFVLASLATLVDAQQAFWMGNVSMGENNSSDPLRGWRPRCLHYLHAQPERVVKIKKLASEVDELAPVEIDIVITEPLREVGTFRALTQHQIVPESWYETSFYKMNYGDSGISDMMFVAVPMNEDVESWFGFHRINHHAAYFSELDRQNLMKAVRPMQWFHHQVVLSHGLALVDKPFTPSERRVLHRLLSNETEAEIASQLGLTHSTVHTYTKRICRKYGVRGRTGLTALWLNR